MQGKVVHAASGFRALVCSNCDVCSMVDVLPV